MNRITEYFAQKLFRKAKMARSANRSSDESGVEQRLLSLRQWTADQKRRYGSREGLDNALKRMIIHKEYESVGLKGPMLDTFLFELQLIPTKAWGGELGWRSKKRQMARSKLLHRAGISTSPIDPGILVRFYFNPTSWLPHPYVPPFWSLTSYEKFAEQITPNMSAFELAKIWSNENTASMQKKISDTLRPYPVRIGARYRVYNSIDYLELAILFQSDPAHHLQLQTIWKSETELAVLVRKYFPDMIREWSPDWLGAQRIDIFIPSLKIGIEYNGEQHYKPVEFFGGDKGFESLVERDHRKKYICEQNGIQIIEWRYDLQINDENLIKVLTINGINISKN